MKRFIFIAFIMTRCRHHQSVADLSVAESQHTGGSAKCRFRIRTDSLDIASHPEERRNVLMSRFSAMTFLAFHLRRENGHDPRFAIR